MKYIVIELQDNGETVGNIVTAYDTLPEAESKYHAVLSAAAVSPVPIHSAILINSMGFVVDTHCYEKGAVDDDA